MNAIMVIVFFIGLWAGLFALSSWLFMIVWNAVIPNVTSMSELTFWYAAGIVFLLGFIRNVVRK